MKVRPYARGEAERANELRAPIRLKAPDLASPLPRPRSGPTCRNTHLQGLAPRRATAPLHTPNVAHARTPARPRADRPDRPPGRPRARPVACPRAPEGAGTPARGRARPLRCARARAPAPAPACQRGGGAARRLARTDAGRKAPQRAHVPANTPPIRRACVSAPRRPCTIWNVTEIVSVAAWKGGVGKSTLAYELAFLLDAPLVDLDWDRGGVTRHWGYRHENRMRAPLLDAIERGRTPTPLRGDLKPDLVPSHPDLVDNQPTPEDMANALEKWAGEWGRDYVIVDTHPGGVASTYGAISAGC